MMNILLITIHGHYLISWIILGLMFIGSACGWTSGNSSTSNAFRESSWKSEHDKKMVNASQHCVAYLLAKQNGDVATANLERQRYIDSL